MSQEKVSITLVSLRWAAHLDKVGSFKVFVGTTLGTGLSTTSYAVSRVLQGKKWQILQKSLKLDIPESCVASRQYLGKPAEQGKLSL